MVGPPPSDLGSSLGTSRSWTIGVVRGMPVLLRMLEMILLWMLEMRCPNLGATTSSSRGENLIRLCHKVVVFVLVVSIVVVMMVFVVRLESSGSKSSGYGGG